MLKESYLTRRYFKVGSPRETWVESLLKQTVNIQIQVWAAGTLTLHPQVCLNTGPFCLTGVYTHILWGYPANVQPCYSPVLLHYESVAIRLHGLPVSLPYGPDWPRELADELCRLVLCYVDILHGTDYLHSRIYKR